MEFFQRQDAYNVFDYLWPNDLLSLSSTCVALRETVNSYCSNLKQLEPSSSSNAESHPSICLYLHWWLRHCLQCKNEMEVSKCLDIKNNLGFIPQALKDYTLIPICSKDCAYEWPYLKKITKTEAIKQYSLNEKELSAVRHIEKQNPYYRSAASMKLFFVSEVELAAMTKFKVANRSELLALLNQRREKRATRTEQMRRNKQLSKDEREKELKTELEKHGLELRSDSQIAELYITNSKRAFTMDKSVELIRRAHIVHQHVGGYYRKMLDIAYIQLKEDCWNDHETWSDSWQDVKLSTEDDALQFFKRAKDDGTLTEIRKCQCGEPLFAEEELKKFQKELEKKALEKRELEKKKLQKKKSQKKQKK